jgi:hypothetical protein
MSSSPKCFYCGQAAVTKDHVFMPGGNRTVPACAECAAILQNMIFHTMADRATFLLGQLKQNGATEARLRCVRRTRLVAR